MTTMYLPAACCSPAVIAGKDPKFRLNSTSRLDTRHSGRCVSRYSSEPSVGAVDDEHDLEARRQQRRKSLELAQQARQVLPIVVDGNDQRQHGIFARARADAERRVGTGHGFLRHTENIGVS